MLSDTNYKLRDSVRVMQENLDISNNIEIELSNQTEKMKANKERLIDMREDIGKGEKHIKNMMLRIRKNKLVLAGVFSFILVIGVIIAIVHFSRWFLFVLIQYQPYKHHIFYSFKAKESEAFLTTYLNWWWYSISSGVDDHALHQKTLYRS